MQVKNQKPAVLSPIYKSNIKGDFEPLSYLKKTVVEPLFVPLVTGQNVSMTDSGQSLNEDDITNYISACCCDTLDINMENKCKNLFEKTLVYFDSKTNLTVQDLFPIQSAVRENQNTGGKYSSLPFPDANIVYTPATDVIPNCRKFLAGQCSYDMFFGSLAFYARPNSLGFYFANEVAFDEFKKWLENQVQIVNSVLPNETLQLFSDFKQITLDGLTESFILRNNDSDNNDEYSFARMFIAYLMQYTSVVSQSEFGVLPFALGELFCPKTVILVNVEKHSKANAKQVSNEWKIINNSLKMKIKMVSNKRLNNLTATARNLSNIAASAKATAASNRQNTIQKSMMYKFRKNEPSKYDFVKMVKKLVLKLSNVAKSENTYKSVKNTFAKPNRRNPDDFNKQGKIVSTKYKPDIHIYLDTSGSISEDNYESAVKLCILLAKKLNVNLYFNSFSHVLSQCTKLNTKNRSTKQIYKQFQKVPKVNGGTDYAQIWEYINANKKRRRELSILITDFEYTPPSHYIPHPKNLYYAPCANMNWDRIVSETTHFCTQMLHNEPNIRKRILF